MESEVVVGKRGRITIPSKLRQKLGIKGGTKLKVKKTPEGILFLIEKPENNATEERLRNWMIRLTWEL